MQNNMKPRQQITSPEILFSGMLRAKSMYVVNTTIMPIVSALVDYVIRKIMHSS